MIDLSAGRRHMLARRPLVLGFSVAAAMAFAPGVAHAGFLDQLFGGGTLAPAQPTYGYEQPGSMSPDLGTPIAPRRAAPKKVAAREVLPVRQKTTDLMHDKTLHPGDAVMMKDGLHVYAGGDGAKHTPKQFVAIDDARMSNKSRAALVAMDTTRNDPLQSGAAPDTIASGRSASVGTPVSKGFKITDARGQSVRYVGP